MPLPPYGGVLVQRLCDDDTRERLVTAAPRLRSLTVDAWAASDLEMLAVGAYSPLRGFMDAVTYRHVVRDMRLPSGLPWTLPITLPVDEVTAAGTRIGEQVALRDEQGVLRGIVTVAEAFRVDPEAEAEHVYRTTDIAHPGVRRLYDQPVWRLAGDVWVTQLPEPDFPAIPRYPAEVRAALAKRGWRTVVGFQTRNPVHRAHEYIQKCALETVDGLLLHPLVGSTKEDDVPAEVRMASYQALLAHYYPQERVLLAVYPAAMRYAGPREAVFHAIVRRNYGCTHFVVGRDHAGVGHYYGTYEAQDLFDRFDPKELGIVPLKFEHAFYCKRCGNMATAKTCPHDAEHHVTLSGTKVRAMLAAGEMPPAEFSRPEVAALLVKASRERTSV